MNFEKYALRDLSKSALGAGVDPTVLWCFCEVCFRLSQNAVFPGGCFTLLGTLKGFYEADRQINPESPERPCTRQAQ